MNPSSRKNLRGLLISQFFGAFNDNAWKMIVALLAIKAATANMSSGEEIEAATQMQTTIAFVVFTLPLALFSLPSGLIADRYSKRTIIIWMKALEIILMFAATTALFTTSDPNILLLILGLMGMQSALFSPAKYGIIPELVPNEELSEGNGALEMWTFLAIIGGTAASGALLDGAGSESWKAAAILAFFSILGFFASLKIPEVPAANAQSSLAGTVTQPLKIIFEDRILYLAVLGSVLYWTIASLIGQNVLIYAKSLTRFMPNSDTLSALPMGCFGIGVGFGSLLAGKWSGRRVEYGLIPLGALGIAVLTTSMGLIGPQFIGTTFLMTLLGIASGFIVVPLNSIIQWRSPKERRGGIIALSNVFIFGGIMLGSLGAWVLTLIGLSVQQVMICTSITTIAATLWAIKLLPSFLIRFVFVILTHTFYRLTVTGKENIPDEGGALIIPNHVSFIDGFIVMASVDRPVRFIVDEQYYENFWFHPLMKAMEAIPVSATGGIRVILRALREAGRYLDEGDLVCIFAEGQVTRTGMMLPFRRGLERIVKGRTAPIIPAHLDRIWGSIYSRSEGRFFTKLPKRYPYPITVSFGKPMPSDTPAHQVRQIVQELGVSAWEHRRIDAAPLHRVLIKRMRTRPWRFAAADQSRPKISRIALLAGSVAVARALREVWQGQENVGIILPPSVGGAFVNFAASIMGKTSVNLNFTAGAAGMKSASSQAGIQTIVTNRDFLEKAKIELPADIKTIFIEDLVRKIGPIARLSAFFAALLLPVGMLERFCGATQRSTIDDTATIIFSSGSTGDPKGVMLSHYNILANVEGVAQVLGVGESDRLLGVLPLFHSFGYMSLWFASTTGMGMVFHPNPLDAVKIGELVEKFHVSMLISTPTFLQIYMRRVSPGQFGSLKIVFTGAEKLSQRLCTSFEEKFGIKPIEGYGATECAPAISVSTLDFRDSGIYQFGSRKGYVGHPVPGVTVKTVDPETLQPLAPQQPGMLLVKGPNIMKGYLNREDLTAKAIKDGWYITGDIAMMDESGFIKITDRLSRFSKIGGEMIPHGKVEEALHQACQSDIQVFAVTAVPDERKGEKLVVLHTVDEARIPELLDNLAQSGLPNLFIPRKENFIKVEKIPVLGTGKIDLRRLKETALHHFSSN